MKTIWT